MGSRAIPPAWLDQNTQLNRYVAVKVGTASSSLRDMEILRNLSTSAPVSSHAFQGRDSIPLPLNEFQLEGPNGTHPCYTMALELSNLRTLSYSQLPVNSAKTHSGQVSLAVAYIHAQEYVHRDTPHIPFLSPLHASNHRVFTPNNNNAKLLEPRN